MNSEYVHNPFNTACQIEYQYTSVSRRQLPICSSNKKYYILAGYNKKRRRFRKKQECERDNHEWVYISDQEPEDDDEQICPHGHKYRYLDEHDVGFRREHDRNHRCAHKHKRYTDTTYNGEFEYKQEHHLGCIHYTEHIPGNLKYGLQRKHKHQYIHSIDNAKKEDGNIIKYKQPTASKQETHKSNHKLYEFTGESDNGQRSEHSCIHNTVHFNSRQDNLCALTTELKNSHNHCSDAIEQKCIEEQLDVYNNNMKLTEYKISRVQIQYECNSGLTPTYALIQDLDSTEKLKSLNRNTESVYNKEKLDSFYCNKESIQDEQMVDVVHYGTKMLNEQKQNNPDLTTQYEHKIIETIRKNTKTGFESSQEYQYFHNLNEEAESENKQKNNEQNSVQEILSPKSATLQRTEKESDFTIPNIGSEHITNNPKTEHCKMDWENYHRLDDIHDFIDKLEVEFPSLCTSGIIGTSREGRNIKVLKISNSDAKNESVWMDAGIHAREWIGPAVNTYVANFIARNFSSLPKCVTNKDWYFLPVLNPDGYEYSHEHDRMWRKNRAWYSGRCVGVDLNRNFSFNWGGKGSSHIPTHCFYRGPEPFSEPESFAIKEFMIKSGIKFKVYITLHSYGQVIIFPFASKDDLCPDYIRLLQGACAMSKAIHDTNGTTYKVGLSKDMMYRASGTSTDWCYGALGIPYCYLIELRSKKHKFKLPKEEILETGQEILNCILALANFVDRYDKIDCERKDESN